MSGVRVWACAMGASKAISARHGKAARKTLTRQRRPLAGPDITIKYPNEFIRLTAGVHACANAPVENVVNGVKTIMVNEPLRAGTGASPREIGRAKEGPGVKAMPPPP